ncbi:hypothetical protein ACH4E7_38550 [Kitasatospora sp. NPDC018058]|uniref:hypothetical protein n=1 Tax=Kitasatospora sp. NPDC018058 TaxID=3364025 RepID=UPI0037BE2BAC
MIATDREVARGQWIDGSLSTRNSRSPHQSLPVLPGSAAGRRLPARKDGQHGGTAVGAAEASLNLRCTRIPYATVSARELTNAAV